MFKILKKNINKFNKKKWKSRCQVDFMTNSSMFFKKKKFSDYQDGRYNWHNIGPIFDRKHSQTSVLFLSSRPDKYFTEISVFILFFMRYKLPSNNLSVIIINSKTSFFILSSTRNRFFDIPLPPTGILLLCTTSKSSCQLIFFNINAIPVQIHYCIFNRRNKFYRYQTVPFVSNIRVYVLAYI